jgi:N-acetylmuramoyl-L-alanine amidase
MNALDSGSGASPRSLWAGALLALVGALLSLPGSGATPAHAGVEFAPKVQDVRITRRGERTRVVIDINRKMGFRYIVFDDPPRLAIDLPDIGWSVPEGANGQHVGLIEGFRFGHFRRGLSRLVFDVTQPFRLADVFELAPTTDRGYRIVVDLVAAGPPPPIVARDEPERQELFVPEPVAAPDPVANANGAAVDEETRTAALVVPHHHPIPAEKPRPPAKRLIVIDPGHGGADPGAISRRGVMEKDVVLAVAHELRRALQASGRYDVVMTRDDDSTLRLRDRLAIARHGKGDLFVSLHADNLLSAPEVRGVAVYTLSEDASNREAARLASKENRADILAGIDLSDQEQIVTQILIDLAQRDANNRSIRFADGLVTQFAEVTELSRRKRQQAGFVVLKSPDMPSALIELGYLSNASDEKLLLDEAHHAKLAGAIVHAVDAYFTGESS